MISAKKVLDILREQSMCLRGIPSRSLRRMRLASSRTISAPSIKEEGALHFGKEAAIYLLKGEKKRKSRTWLLGVQV